jgi:hypothetical protein
MGRREGIEKKKGKIGMCILLRGHAPWCPTVVDVGAHV